MNIIELPIFHSVKKKKKQLQTQVNMSEIEQKKRKVYRQSKSMLEAIAAVERKEGSIRKIAKEYGVDRNSLSKRVKSEIAINSSQGKYKLLTREEEEGFVTMCINVSKMGLPLTRKMLQEEIREFCLKKGRPVSEDGPSMKYVSLFLKRHKELAIRTPQGMKQSQSQEKTLEVVQEYLQLVLFSFSLFSLFSLFSF